MLRRFHSFAGLVATLLIATLAITGAILAIEPVRERAGIVVPAAGQLSVAVVAEAVKAQHPQVERIVKTASGSVIAHVVRDGQSTTVRVDPLTGQPVTAHEVAAVTQFATELHRSLLLGESGRIVAGLGALAMVILTISGTMLLASRVGGWSALLRPIRGKGVHRFHSSLARFAMLPLLLSAMTGSYMSLATLGVIGDGMDVSAPAPMQSRGQKRLAVGKLPALLTLDLSDLRELTFPRGKEPADVYTITTSQGVGQIDAATGRQLAFGPHGVARRIYETIYMLHTGQGLWPLAIVVGLASLTAPLLAVAGILIWWARRRSRPRIRHNVSAGAADTIILVGSEGNSTWAFAEALHVALTKAGRRVHAASMNSFTGRYKRAKRMVILTATYGDGAPPLSANRFLQRLARSRRSLPVAVLGFGDRGFPRYCRFADDVAAALQRKGWPMVLPTSRIDRQSVQEFTRWAEAYGDATGTPLQIGPFATTPKTTKLRLVKRFDYGGDVQDPTSVLRFVADDNTLASGRTLRWLRTNHLPGFEVGDLVGVVAPGGHAPRYYSLASSKQDGILEICVRKQPSGACSGFLHDLRPGATIDGFVRANPAFRPLRGKAPLILIGAGTGIGPLAGFIRQNAARRPVHLYWGGRHPASDFLYKQELASYLHDKRLTRFRPAFSRVEGGFYVQDRLAAEAGMVRDLIRDGGQVMVCGGQSMATDVAYVVSSAIQPLGLSLSKLKSEGRYLEDVY